MSVSSAHCEGFLSVPMLEASLFIGAAKHLGRYMLVIQLYYDCIHVLILYSCSQCLQTNNTCGWCIYNKICSGTATPCVNGTENYLQVRSHVAS